MTRTLGDYVAAQIRAEMGRQQISASALARILDVDDTWVGRRIRGKSAITIDDLEKFAKALDVPALSFMPAAERVA
jgi:transcriptional regulator with XRE-family HTH domain